MQVLVVSDLSIYTLANSFIRALEKEGHEVKGFDIHKSIRKYIRLGKIGQKIHSFWPVETWIRKGNRELAVFFTHYQPDKVIVFGNSPVLYGTLAFWKSISDKEIILFWPDALTNLEQNQINGAKLYDVLATYSEETIPVFRKIGFDNIVWLPFAGDIDFLGAPTNFDGEFAVDLSFLGGWRPEREKAISAILNSFPQMRIHVRGFYWKERCKNKSILKNFNPQPLFAKDFGDFIRRSRINLNVIDDTNYPAANMRFFEIPAAGGLQLCSDCPEQKNIFLHGRHILYYKSENDLLQQIQWVLDHVREAAGIRQQGHALIQSGHCYTHRIKQLFG